MKNMKNFIEALSLLDPQVPKEYEFRLYYDKESGDPLFYSMTDDPGDYIVITAQQFAESRFNIRVENGEIKTVKEITIGKLVPSDGGYGTTANDISIVGTERYWSLRTYD